MKILPKVQIRGTLSSNREQTVHKRNVQTSDKSFTTHALATTSPLHTEVPFIFRSPELKAGPLISSGTTQPLFTSANFNLAHFE